MKRRFRTYLRVCRIERKEANVRTPKPESERRIRIEEMTKELRRKKIRKERECVLLPSIYLYSYLLPQLFVFSPFECLQLYIYSVFFFNYKESHNLNNNVISTSQT